MQVKQTLLQSSSLKLQVLSFLWVLLSGCTSFNGADRATIITGSFLILLLLRCCCIKATESSLNCGYLTSNSSETALQPFLLGSICASTAD